MVAAEQPPGTGSLPELAAVPWRRRPDGQSLRLIGRLWTFATAAHTVPLVGGAVGLAALNPITIPVGLILLVHAWAIPELYAARGARVVARPEGGKGQEQPERVALGFLGDLLDYRARELQARTGLALERGRLGAWLVGERGALLVAPGGRRVHCYCVRVPERGVPAADRIAHLLLALRTDEEGFATVANLAFAGAPWRLRRRLPGPAREALEEAVRAARRISA